MPEYQYRADLHRFRWIMLTFLALLAVSVSDADKLKIRESQLRRMAATAQVAQLGEQYRDAKAAAEQAAADAKAVLDAVAAHAGCKIDPNTADCTKEPVK